jgi:hypothetical protein
MNNKGLSKIAPLQNLLMKVILIIKWQRYSGSTPSWVTSAWSSHCPTLPKLISQFDLFENTTVMRPLVTKGQNL